MKTVLKINVSEAAKCGDALYNNRILRNKLNQIFTNVWESDIEYKELPEIIEQTLFEAGIDPDEYTLIQLN